MKIKIAKTKNLTADQQVCPHEDGGDFWIFDSNSECWQTNFRVKQDVNPQPHLVPPPSMHPAAEREFMDEQELLAAAANPVELGDKLAAIIHRTGADKVYKTIRHMMGLKLDCNCNARRKAINSLGAWLRQVTTGDSK
jgi:hypothetical protein